MSKRARFHDVNKAKLEQTKLHLCRQLRRSMARTGWSQTGLAAWLGTSRANVSKVQCGRTDELTFNQLFRYLARLEPHFEILVSI